MASDTFTGADHDTLDDDTADALETLAELTERQDPRPARFSRHARRRAARRNLLPDAVDCVLTHGRCLYRTGVTFYLLARRDLPPAGRRAAGRRGWRAPSSSWPPTARSSRSIATAAPRRPSAAR